MSFSRASLKRFNEVQGCAPPVGHYDPKGPKTATGPAFEKSDRFQNDREFGPSPADFDISSCSMLSVGNPTAGGVFSSTPRKKSLSSASSMESLREKKVKNQKKTHLSNKVKELEREIKKILQEKRDLDKRMKQKEDEVTRLESRLQHVQSDSTALLAKVASLEKDIKDVNISNSILKSKVSTAEGTAKKRDEKLHAEMTDIRKQLEKKEKEMQVIKRDIDEAVTGLLQDLQGVASVTDRLNNKVSQLEQSFDDKDVDSTESAKGKKVKADDKPLEKINKAREDTKRIKLSLEELDVVTKRKITNVKSQLREKYEGTLAKLQQLSDELKMKEENLESTKTCTDALKEYGDALRRQNRSLMLIVTHLRQEQWQCEDTIRSLKGEVFALSDENKVYEQQTFESNAELATLLEKIEQLEEKEDMLNTNIKSMTEKYHILEQNMEEEQRHHQVEYEKLSAELLVTQKSLQDMKSECETSQKTNKDLIHRLNTAQSDSEKLTSELEKYKSISSELQSLSEIRVRDIAEKDVLLHQTQDRIDTLSQEIALKSSQIDSLQTRLSESENTESSLRSQISDMTSSHKKTVDVYRERIEKLEEEKSALLEEKHNLLSQVDTLMAEKAKLASNVQATEVHLEEIKTKYELDIKAEKEKITVMKEKYLQSEKEYCEKFQHLESQLNSVSLKCELDMQACEERVNEMVSTLTEVRAERDTLVTQLASNKENLNMVTEELDAAMEDVTRMAAEKETVIQQYEEQLASVHDEKAEEKQQWEEIKQELTNRLQDSQNHILSVQEHIKRLESENSTRETELNEKLSMLSREMDEASASWEMERQSLNDQLEHEEKQIRHAEEDLVRLQTEKEMELQELKDRFVGVCNELTLADTSRRELTVQLTASQKAHSCTQEKLTSLKEDMLAKESELRGHLVEAEGEVSRLFDLKNSQAEIIKQLEKEKASAIEERNRLKEEKLYDATCSGERFAVLEENAREQRKLFEELKEDFTSKLAATKAEKSSVVEEFELYKSRSETQVKLLKQDLQLSEEATVKAEQLQTQVELLKKEKSALTEEVESMKLSSMQTLGQVQAQLVKAENDVAELLSKKLAQEEKMSRLQEEKGRLSEERTRCVSEYNSLAKELEQLREEQHQLESQAAAVDTDTLMEEINKWRTLYEDLEQKVAPFIEQIDAFEAERQCLLGRNANAQAEVNKLSMEYAKLLGHQNQKQKIKHIVKLKEENNALKKETTLLREQVSKLKRQMERQGGDKLNLSQSVRKKFDPSKAFQYSKENRTPTMSPLKDGNRR